MKLIISAIFIHLIFIGAIFDLYFQSPIITSGIQSQKNDRNPPAKRLVLFVADGLRAESLYGTDFKQMCYVSPYLCQKVKSHETAWGISHTRAPTESRPGHVALAAGIYEDPSAATKLFKENPVDFDTVFNESFHTWIWSGSTSVPLFNKSENVEAYCIVDSWDISYSLPDIWVFGHVNNFFKDDLSEDTFKLLHSDKIIFALFLSGVDDVGSIYKPGSTQHMQNIRDVDHGIKIIEESMELFYGDNKTAFILTADHGMTDTGSHGGDSAHETETPVIIWGAGVKPTKEKIKITQVDITPLMSILTGIPIPVNSIGMLPTDILNISDEDKAHALFLNAKQIYAQFDEKCRLIETTSIWLLYKPYRGLLNQEFKNIISDIESSLKDDNYDYVMKSSEDLIQTCIEGLEYYQNYYQRLLLFCVTGIYLGWIGTLLIHLTEPSKEQILNPRRKVSDYFKNYIRRAKYYIILDIVLICAILAIWVLLYVQSFPLMYYIYCTLPLCIWWHILEKTDDWVPRTASLFVPFKRFALTIGGIILYISGIEILVLCFFFRQSLCLTLFIMALWPYFVHKVNYRIKCAWMTSCFALAIFPFLPVENDFNLYLIIVTAVVWILVLFGSLVVNYFTAYPRCFINKNQMRMAIFQSFLLAIAVFNLCSINANSNNLIWYNQFCSWSLSALAIFVTIFGSNKIVDRLMNIAMGLLIPFMLLSVNYEPLFLLVLFLNLLLWLYIEHVEYSPIAQNLTDVSSSMIFNSRSLITNKNQISVDFRRGFFILMYTILAFFGMSNSASFSSFDSMLTRNFIYDDRIIKISLIIFKFIIPHLVISCVLRAVTTCVQAPVKKVFFILLLFCDIMGIHFLFMVKNTGSWLEIGISVSNYLIAQTLTLFLVLLYVLVIPLVNPCIRKKICNLAMIYCKYKI